jgi:uncharacterized protein YodC (DUF2158 family)
MAQSKGWKTGDKVRLVSGGPVMSVKRTYVPAYATKEVVSCQWFDSEGKLQAGVFPPESLVRADD